MQRPPPISDAHKFPITSAVALAAMGATFAFWKGTDVSMLFMGPEAFTKEPWRLVTSALPHGTMVHIFFNLYWLWAFGTILERGLGSLRFLGLILLFAAASAAGEWAIFGGGIGLSGVGYGLFGMLWAMKRRPAFVGAVDQRTRTMFIAWGILCVITTWIGVMNVANVAHGAGLLVGYLTGMCVAERDTKRNWAIVGLAATLVAIGLGATVARPWVNLERLSPHGLAMEAADAIKAKDYAKAEALLWRAVRKNPDDPYLWMELGSVLDAQGREQDAMDKYDRALKLDPTNAKLAEYIQKRRTAPDPADPAGP